MKKVFLVLFVAIYALLLFGCSAGETHKNIKIATNSWIGYTPLFYAQETGELKKLGFELVMNVSLAEAMELYAVDKADMVTTTQHEFYALKQMSGDIRPVILIDRSYGGDVILGNKPLSQIKNAKKIDVYLEVDSINSELLQEFMKKYSIEEKKIQLHNQDQQKITQLRNDSSKRILAVSYIPYSDILQKNGFIELASTKDIDDLIVIDALCVRKKVLKNHKAQLEALKKVIDAKIEQIRKEPKKSYAIVKNYLKNISYEEYVEGLKKIKWINKPSQKLLQVIEPMGYEKEELLQ